MKGLIIGIWFMTIIFGNGENNANIQGSENTTTKTYDVYQMFYGTWQITEVVSQHGRLGGDEGYEDIIGEYVTYTKDYFECGGDIINNPSYMISILPIKDNEYNQFFVEQKGIEKLLPGAKFFTFVRVLNRPIGAELKREEYIGNEFFIKDDNTMYCFDYNCIYELQRVEYLKEYNQEMDLVYY